MTCDESVPVCQVVCGVDASAFVVRLCDGLPGPAPGTPGEHGVDAAGQLLRAVEQGRASGKRLIVDLAGLTVLTRDLLNVLLVPIRRGGQLPWLAGPLSTQALRRLRVTGTYPLFEVFPTLAAALRRATV
ncbi:hypothetical protein ABT160_07795 [Streptomyces sp. NPDC001941]|uniref:hypothetical protein n=1 Tax=Streptomyces sp. NPDC001941 TaxID=3154659 RepID=UPI00332EC6FE